MKNLYKALAEFQQECPIIHKGTQGYGYSYADLPAILEIINPILKKHGLGFYQKIDTREDKNYLTTVVFHFESGESIESTVFLPLISFKGMNDYQATGSGITYFRRYALSAMLGIVTDKDTDASGEQQKKEEKKNDKENKLNYCKEIIKNCKSKEDLMKLYADFQESKKLTEEEKQQLSKICQEKLAYW